MAQTAYQKAGIDSAAIQKNVNKEFQRQDSIKNALAAQRTKDSTNRALEKIRLQLYKDSVTQARIAQRIKDSIDREKLKQKIIQERITRDSLAAVQKKRTEDSLTLVRQRNDSIRVRNKFILDSTRTARAAAKLKREALAKYKKSRRYTDSVATARAERLDSIKQSRIAANTAVRNEQNRIRDSIRTRQKESMDSATASVKRTRDSTLKKQKEIADKVKESRQKFKDSLLASRQKIKDSIQAIRDAKEKKLAGKTKDGKDSKDKKDLKLSIALHEKKTEEWTNEKLLKRKWSLQRRIYQNTVTRYNAYYHAKRKYDESIQSLKKNHKDDYTKPISLYPYDAEKAGGSVSGNMDSVIKKASYSTQIHDPRSKWFDNLYMLMAKAYFLKNDYDNAIMTCQFIISEYKETSKSKSKRSIDTSSSIATKEKTKKLIAFLKHKPIRNEAILLLVNSYVMTEQYGEAQTMIALLEKDKVLPKKYLPELMMTKANLALRQKNRTDAIAALDDGLKYPMSGMQKSRLRFLLAQLYAEDKQFDKSTAQYKKSFYKKNLPETDFYTKLHIAENAAQSGQDADYAVTQLQKIIKDPKYSKFKSQALLTLAQIQAKENIDKAVATLIRSIEDKENKDGKVKASAYAQLGNIYYDAGRYIEAKQSYDSCILYSSSNPIESLEDLMYRRNVLVDVVIHVNTIRDQDSLLALAAMSDKDRKAIVKKQIDKIISEKKKAQQSKVETLKPINKNDPNAAVNWYFANPDMVEQGSKDFITKWGNRKLQDNWRRASANALSTDGLATEEEEEEGLDAASSGDLWSKIPMTPAQKDSCHFRIQQAYYALGLAYYSQLENYPRSTEAFDTLLTRYKNTALKPETYYGQYLNYTKLKNEPKAAYYSNLLQQEFPNSSYTLLTSNADVLRNQYLATQAAYEKTYGKYKDNQFEDALADIQKIGKENTLLAKYKLMEALCYAGLKDLGKCKSGLTAVISSFPETSEQKKAQEYLSFFSSLENANAPKDSNAVSKTVDSTQQDVVMNAEGKGNYIYNPEEEHLTVIYLKNADNKTIAFKSGVSDYNLLKYDIENYSTGLNFLSTSQALVTIKLFPTVQSAKKYMNDMRKEKNLFSQLKPSDYELMIISKSNFTEMLKTRDVNGYMTFFSKNY